MSGERASILLLLFDFSFDIALLELLNFIFFLLFVSVCRVVRNDSIVNMNIFS